MRRDSGPLLCRVSGPMLAFSVLLLVTLPEAAIAHEGGLPTDIARQIEAGLAGGHQESPSQGHCHPGVDCSNTVAFLLDPEVPASIRPRGTPFRLFRRDPDRWRPNFELPPPRTMS